MKLLLDANISYRLKEKLKPFFEICIHVESSALSIPAKDIDVWNYAKDNDLMIVTNDDDFSNLLNVKGFPPKIVLLKTGNQSTSYIESLLLSKKDEIIELYHSPDYGLLEIF